MQMHETLILAGRETHSKTLDILNSCQSRIIALDTELKQTLTALIVCKAS